MAEQTTPIPPPEPARSKPRWFASRWFIGIVSGVVGLFIGIGIGGSSSSDDTTTTAESSPGATVTVSAPAKTVTQTVQATVTAKPAGPAAAIPGDGTYLVGKDIKAGQYRTQNPDGSCYWARLKGTGGGVDDIIANGNPSGPAIVTIAASDKAFESQRCGEWAAV
jgi:hypothetical protein